MPPAQVRPSLERLLWIANLAQTSTFIEVAEKNGRDSQISRAASSAKATPKSDLPVIMMRACDRDEPSYCALREAPLSSAAPAVSSSYIAYRYLWRASRPTGGLY